MQTHIHARTQTQLPDNRSIATNRPESNRISISFEFPFELAH